MHVCVCVCVCVCVHVRISFNTKAGGENSRTKTLSFQGVCSNDHLQHKILHEFRTESDEGYEGLGMRLLYAPFLSPRAASA